MVTGIEKTLVIIKCFDHLIGNEDVPLVQQTAEKQVLGECIGVNTEQKVNTLQKTERSLLCNIFTICKIVMKILMIVLLIVYTIVIYIIYIIIKR